MKKLIAIIGSIFISLSISTAIQAKELTGKMPDFTLAQAKGPNIRLENLKGQVVMMNFWATWCGPCRQEMPELEALYQRYKNSGFTILGINIENSNNVEKRKEIENFITETNLSFPILYDFKKEVTTIIEQDFINKRMGMPTTIFIDRNGNTRFFHEAYRPGDENKYEKVINILLSE
jgi:thiol-disulfide isomerase/thioredoxin